MLIRPFIPKYLLFVVTLLTVVVVEATAFSENWGHWRGAGGNGVAVDANPPVSFSSTENIAWKTPIEGSGSGSPVIWQDVVFVTSAIEQRDNPNGSHRFVLYCIDRKTGKIVWQRVAAEGTPHEGTHETNTYASASPCTDGVRVYASFGSRGLYAYTFDGELVWKRNFGNMQMRNGFGEGSSPTISGNRLIVPWDHEGPSQLYSLDTATGEIVWQVARDEVSNWGTPLIIEHDGKKQIITTGENLVRSYDFDSGALLWYVGGQTQRPAASPVAGDGLVFVGSGFRGSFLGAFRPDGRGDIEDTSHVVWTRDRDTPDIGSPLLSNSRLYFYKGKTGLLTCVDAATGEPHYVTARIDGLGSIYASPVAAGGYVYLTDRSGTIVVIRESNELEIVSTNSMNETVDATPAPVDNQLFVRGARHLFCVEARQ
ncbi:outer membrane biogenesis protein BamB [Neorhodopirellula pilleata]|uniref:Outer membrane biogenesis protein BamB n=2 Tax=Neorhodopirellula pilleata TaxID=2714738 RepID=A0A5C6B0U6_9BACT|nr:outer membrane biogenesis protein BamB [Neorhodopirellula pilleata]